MGTHSASYKPIITGCAEADLAASDTGRLLAAQGLPLTQTNIDRISPFRFHAPLAPSMAARLENRRLDFDAVIAHSRQALAGSEDLVLIEGIGGVMVPLDDTHTVLDWIKALAIPALLVTGNYLGSLSHTLTAVSALRQSGIPLRAIVLNESESDGVDLAATAVELRHWTRSEVLIVQRGATEAGDLAGLLMP